MQINLYIEEKAYSFNFNTKLRDVLRHVLGDNPELGDIRYLEDYRMLDNAGEELDLDLMICETSLEDSSCISVKGDGLSVEQRISEERWLEIVSGNGSLIACVKHKTEKLCMAAVKNKPEALWFIVEDASMEVIHAACSENIKVIEYLDREQEKRYIEYVSQNLSMYKDFIGNISKYHNFTQLKNKQREILLDSAEFNPGVLKFLWNARDAIEILVNKKCSKNYPCFCFEEIETTSMSESDCLKAISGGHSIQSFKLRTEAICLAAIQNKGKEIRYIEEKYMTSDFCEKVAEICPEIIDLIPPQKEDFYIKLMRKDIRFFYKSKVKTGKIYKEFVKQEIWIPGSSFKFIDNFLEKFMEYYSNGYFVNDEITSSTEFLMAVRTFKPEMMYFLEKTLKELHGEEQKK